MPKIRCLSLLLCASGFACTDDPTVPVQQHDQGPAFSVLGGSGCYMVEFQEYDPVGHAPGILSGDLVGTTTFADYSGWRTGKAGHDSYTLYLHITGSPVIPGLVGETLTLQEVKEIIAAAPGQYPLRLREGHALVFHNGVEVGKVTWKGTTDRIAWVIKLTYKALLCF